MTPRAGWDSCKDMVRRGTAATEEARGANKDVLMLPPGRRTNTTLPPSSGCWRVPPPPVLVCITLLLLSGSLVQLPVAALQLPASSLSAASPPRLHNGSRTVTQQTIRGSTAAPQPDLQARVARTRQDQSQGALSTGKGAVSSPSDATPPHHVQGGAPHTRFPRSVTKIRRIELHGPPLPDRRTLFVEVVVLADYSFYSHYRRRDAFHRAAQVLSVANKVLGGVGVMLVPAVMRVWDRGDKFRVTSRMDTNIDGLQQYRLSLLQQEPDLPNDHTILLTRKQMRGQVVYGGPVRGMCRRRESVSVVQDEGETPSLAGLTLAHQMGHSLGMEDDAEGVDHACRCHAATCVMSRHFRNDSSPKLEWSSCSKKSLSAVADTLVLDCLGNIPTRRHPSTGCGDGVVDEGEQCDCGPEEFCNNPCCVASTCKLVVNASCASGSCCDTQTCQPKRPGTVCRAASTECDLPEFCSGHSEYCPADVAKADGTACHGEQGHCYNGECGSREGRCEQLWGASSSAASKDCYSNFNIKGNKAGNCGLEYGVYRRCRPEESLCGTLHCLVSDQPSLRLPEHRNGSRRSGSQMCHFVSGSEDYPAHHWLTPNGASCGPGKMCVNRRCQVVPEPTGHCRGGCSGHGVCNARGNCHCDAGYSPPDCSVAGLGGSSDSNVMSGPSDARALVTSMWVLLVLLASLLAVTCCSWGFFKGWYKRKGRDHTSRVLPCCVTCLDTCCCPIMTKSVRWILTVRSSPEEKQSNRNVEAVEGEHEHMLCSVDVDIKGTSQTNSWGVASEKLVTEVVMITPKDSPDLRRKVRLPSEPPTQHHKSQDNLQRPKYFQSISMDSGCVSDTDEDDSSKSSSLHLSMSSLLSNLKRIGDKRGKATPEREISPVRNLGSQKSIPLSRLVVDPLAGGLSSRQGTPPPQQVKPPYCRSYSTDIVSTGRTRTQKTPPPVPPSALKPTKSEENFSVSSEMHSRVRLPNRQNSPPADKPTQVSVSSEDHSHAAGVGNAVSTSDRKVPLLPPKAKPVPSPPKLPPSRGNTPSPPQMTGQRNHAGRPQGKCSPPREVLRPSPPTKTWSEAQESSSGPAASRVNNKVMAMARQFEAE